MRKRHLLFGAPLVPVLFFVLSYGLLLAQTPTPAQESSSLLNPAAPVEANRFALTLEWQRCPNSWCETGWYASPAVADLDENGTPEVYWGGYTLMAVDGESGALIASVPNTSARIWPSIVAADLEGDGTTEIVIANGVGEVSVFGENLVRRLGWPKQPFGQSREIRSLAVADLDADGTMEIILCSTRSDDQWIVLENNGTVALGWPRMTDGDAVGYAAGCYNQNVAAGDIDGDGKGEIVGPNDTHYVAAFEANGEPVRANALYGKVGGMDKPWARVGLHVDHAVDLRGYAECGTEHRPNMANSAPIIGDLDNDGANEVIFVGNVYNCGDDPYRSLYEVPYVLNGDRTRWKSGGYDWTAIPAPASGAAPLSEDYNRIEMNVPNPVLADLDNDGFPEILHTSYDGKLHAWSLGKAEHDSWPYNLQPDGGAYLRFGSEPVVADLDNDGYAEVILATWTENDSNAPGQLLILSHEGNLLQAMNLPWDAEDGRGGALGAPTLANLDGDANLEVVVGTINQGLVAYEIADSANARLLWATGRGSFARSGYASATWASKPVSMEFSVDKQVALPGDVLAYRIVVTNPGTVQTPAEVTVSLPAHWGLDAASIVASRGAVSQVGNQLRWPVGIPAGGSASLEWRGTVADGAPRPGALETVVQLTQEDAQVQEARLQVLIDPVRTMLPSIVR